MALSATGVVLAIVLLVLAASSFALLPPLHPAQLWSMSWFIAVLLYVPRLLPYRSLSWSTTIIAGAAAIAFVLGSLASERWLGSSALGRGPGRALSYTHVRSAAVAATIVALLGVAAFVASAASTYGLHDTFTASQRLRAAIYGGALTVQVKYVWAALAGVTLCSTAAALAPRRRAQALWLLAATGCGASIYFATGRATLVTALVIGSVAYFTTRPRPVRRRRFVAGTLMLIAASLAIFIAGGQLIGKTYENNTDLQSVPSFFTRHPSFSGLALAYQYVSAPVAALDVQVRSATEWGDARGCAAATELCTVLRRLGVRVVPIPRIRPFTAPPLIWNTYTGLDVPLMDWGKALTVPVVGLLGALCGMLWVWTRRRLTVGLLTYSIAAAAIVGSWTTFTFTAPHIVGAALISLLMIWFVDCAPARAMARTLRIHRPDAAGASAP